VKRIVIAEDNEIYRSTLIRMLKDFEIVGEAKDGEQVKDVVRSTRPDLLILDLSMPKISGIEVARQLRRHFQSLKILVLTMYESEELLKEALEAGVDGYCLKDEGREKLLEVIDHILAGHSYVSPTIA
jgi:DNA-binding NarL/FixJ family response regulator